MKDIIKNLYWATMSESDKKLKSKKKYEDACCESTRLITKLKNIMSKRQQDLFDKHYAAVMDVCYQERLQSFEDGLVAGVWLMAYACGEGLFEKQE